MTGPLEYHVLTKRGDAQQEVERIIATVGDSQKAGLHRYFFVSRANQTVVMTAAADTPLARALRSAGGWAEPGLTQAD
jgi:hypothetical protein